MKSQTDFLQEILALKEQNPDAEIVFVVLNSDIYMGDLETLFEIDNIKLGPYYNGYIDQDDINNAIEDLCLSADFSTDDSFEALFQCVYAVEVRTAICVFMKTT